MGNSGCVSFMFEEKGVIEYADEDGEIDEEALMEAALEAGATDFEGEEGYYTVYTEVEDVTAVAEALTAAGYRPESADRAMVPSNYVTLENEDDVRFMTLLLEKLEEDDDVTNVFHNWEM